MLLFSSPLHSLRKTFAFRLLIKSRWNKPRLFNLGFEHKVALRPFTHASIFLGRNKLEPGIRSLILKICKELTQDKKDHFFFDVGETSVFTHGRSRKSVQILKLWSLNRTPITSNFYKSPTV